MASDACGCATAWRRTAQATWRGYSGSVYGRYSLMSGCAALVSGCAALMSGCAALMSGWRPSCLAVRPSCLAVRPSCLAVRPSCLAGKPWSLVAELRSLVAGPLAMVAMPRDDPSMACWRLRVCLLHQPGDARDDTMPQCWGAEDRRGGDEYGCGGREQRPQPTAAGSQPLQARRTSAPPRSR